MKLDEKINLIQASISIFDLLKISQKTSKYGIDFTFEFESKEFEEAEEMLDCEFDVVFGFLKNEKTFCFLKTKKTHEIIKIATEHSKEEKEFIKKKWKEQRLKNMFLNKDSKK